VDGVETEWDVGENSLYFVRAAHLLPSIKDRPQLFVQSRQETLFSSEGRITDRMVHRSPFPRCRILCILKFEWKAKDQ
jgi:hypothetical protein